jgi:site-specific recombinase XerC
MASAATESSSGASAGPGSKNGSSQQEAPSAVEIAPEWPTEKPAPQWRATNGAERGDVTWVASEIETSLVRVTGGALTTELTVLSKKAEEHRKRSRADRTITEYEKQWATFRVWCRKHDRAYLPADANTLELYITDRAESVGLSSLNQALAAISHYHNKANVICARHHPVFKEAFNGIVRGKSSAKKKKDALTLVKLERMLPLLSGDTAIRDRAILLVGYSAALRRNELVSAFVEHFARDELGRGYVLNVPRSKTDQRGEGRVKAVPFSLRSRLMCPASALEDWFAVSGIISGPAFRGIQNGSITEDALWDARRNKRSWAEITKQTGQTEKTAEGYVRQEEIWTDNAAVELFR